MKAYMVLAAAVLVSLLLTACAAPTSGPTTWLDQPLDGDQVPLDLVKLQAHAADANGVGRFEFYVNETLLSSPAGSGGRFSQALVEWVPPAPGTYAIRARAIGAGGNPGTDAKAVILVAGLPTATPTATVYPLPMCTPPKCNAGDLFYCPGDCPGGCGTQCATPTSVVTIIEPTPLPVDGITPVPGCPGVPVISFFTANPGTITAGGSSTLTWGPITNADSALIDNGIGGPLLTGGTFPVSPTRTTTYVLAATGCGGTVVKSVTITVLPVAPIITATPVPVCPGAPVISSISANPSTITAGQSTTLSWGAVTNATSASIDPGIGGVGTPGSTSVSPGGTTTYTLTATGCGGTVRRQVTVTVNPAPKPITLTPVPLPVVTIIPMLPIDKTPPSISGVSVNPTSLARSGCGQATTARVTAQISDAGGVNRAVVRLGGVGGGEVGMSGSGTYSATVGPFANTGSVSIQVVAWDKAGNSSQAGGPSISVICLR